MGSCSPHSSSYAIRFFRASNLASDGADPNKCSMTLQSRHWVREGSGWRHANNFNNSEYTLSPDNFFRFGASFLQASNVALSLSILLKAALNRKYLRIRSKSSEILSSGSNKANFTIFEVVNTSHGVEQISVRIAVN